MSNESKQVFHEVTAESLPTMKNKYYAGGKELKEGGQDMFWVCNESSWQ